MKEQIYDTVIIGSGPAGLTAAIYNVRADLKVLVIAGEEPGGQLIITTLVENWPGFTDGINGAELMTRMQEQVKNLGGEIRSGQVKKIEKDNGGFKVETMEGEKVKTRAVIVVTGAGARWLGLEKEKELIGKGVSGCATCDGMFFKDKMVAMVGGGDTAVQEAVFLTKFAKKVYLIHRRDELRAGAREQKRALNNPKIEMMWDSEVKGLIKKDEKLGSIRVENNKTGEKRTVEVDGLFVAIGRIPATKFLEGLVEMDEKGFIKTGDSEEYKTMTNVEGVFAAGDCTNSKYKQAVVAAGEGCKAGMDAERWLER